MYQIKRKDVEEESEKTNKKGNDRTSVRGKQEDRRPLLGVAFCSPPATREITGPIRKRSGPPGFEGGLSTMSYIVPFQKHLEYTLMPVHKGPRGWPPVIFGICQVGIDVLSF